MMEGRQGGTQWPAVVSELGASPQGMGYCDGGVRTEEGRRRVRVTWEEEEEDDDEKT